VAPTALAQEVLYGTGGWIGPVVNTSLVIGDPAGDAVSLPSAPSAIAVTQAPDNFPGVDGIMGLAYLSLNPGYDLTAYLTKKKIKPPVTFPWPFSTGNFNTASKQFTEMVKSLKPTPIDPYFTALEDQGLTMNKFAFYTLRSWVRMATTNQTAIAADPWNNGFFILGGGERQTDLYTGDFVTVDVLDDVYYNTNLISVQVGNQPAVAAAPLQAEYSGAETNCIFGTGTSALVLSNDVYNSIMKSLAAMNPSFASLIQQADQNSISSSLLDLAEWPDISFILTGDTGLPVTLTCTPQTYWQDNYPSPGQSVFQIAAAGSGNPVNQSILGLPLMNNYYTVFDRSLGAGNGIIRFAPIVLPAT
jgi:aspartyl protease